MIPFIVPVTEMSAPSEMIEAPAGPSMRVPASASGRSEVARPGSVPMQTTWIRI
jgi:hypothetical protein